jgi:hypothetical protein
MFSQNKIERPNFGAGFPFKIHLTHMTFEILATLFGSNYLKIRVEKAPLRFCMSMNR